MANSLTELYAHPVFQSKAIAAIDAKLREDDKPASGLTTIVIEKDNVARIEGTTSVTATFTAPPYSGTMAITLEEVWQDYSTDELADQAEVEAREVALD